MVTAKRVAEIAIKYLVCMSIASLSSIGITLLLTTIIPFEVAMIFGVIFGLISGGFGMLIALEWSDC